MIKPQKGPQEQFLSSQADIVIYGGGAGGGKTWGLLLEPLRHINNPDFGAVIFRRTIAQVTNEGGLWDESFKLYLAAGGRPYMGRKLYWKFRSGAKITFAHMVHEESYHDWQGSQIALLCFDELTHFRKKQFLYMLSRSRSMSGVKPYIRATCNPDADSWLADFLAWWIDQKTGFANPKRAGRIRWFVNVDGKIVWGKSKEELEKEYAPREALSCTFIPAKVHDNQELLKRDPGYLAKLWALDLVERERLLEGNWKIKAKAGKVFNRDWFPIVGPSKLPPGGELCLFWDFAATEKDLTKKVDGKLDPDYTAAVLMLKVGAGEKREFFILDVWAGQWGPAEVERQFLKITKECRERARKQGRRFKVRWEVEPASAAKRESHRMTRKLAGMDAKGVRPQGDKLVRAKPLAVQAEIGNVSLVKADWNEMWLHHMHHQPETPKKDIMDASSGSFNSLAGASKSVRTQ